MVGDRIFDLLLPCALPRSAERSPRPCSREGMPDMHVTPCLRILPVQFSKSPYFWSRLDTSAQRGKVGHLAFAGAWRGESWICCCDCVTSAALFWSGVINRTGASLAALSSRGRDVITGSAQLLSANVFPLAKGWWDVCVSLLCPSGQNTPEKFFLWFFGINISCDPGKSQWGLCRALWTWATWMEVAY